MTTALIDVPRCLNVDTSYVGAPRELTLSGRPRTAWTESLSAGSTRIYREQAVRECLDTVGMLRSYRSPEPNETWLIPAESERRLLAQVHAIIALGRPALQQVIGMALDPDVPDPGRVFAALFVLGCVEGREFVPPVQELFCAASARTPLESAAAVEALSVSPNPEIAAVLTGLLDDERPRVRSGAIRVLGYRGSLPESAWLDAMRDSDLTLVKAAMSVPLGQYERTSCERALQPMFGSDAESLVSLALSAGVSLRLASAREAAIQIARNDPSWADAGRSLALLGYLGDARYLREALAGKGLQATLGVVAILGSIDLVPDVLEVLNRGSLPPETGRLAKQVLSDLTGLDFLSTTTAPQAIDVWLQSSSQFDPRVRYRAGRPITLDGLLQILRTTPLSRSDRQDIYREMVAATESSIPRFSAFDFVAIQAQSLKRIEQWLGDPAIRLKYPMGIS